MCNSSPLCSPLVTVLNQWSYLTDSRAPIDFSAEGPISGGGGRGSGKTSSTKYSQSRSLAVTFHPGFGAARRHHPYSLRASGTDLQESAAALVPGTSSMRTFIPAPLISFILIFDHFLNFDHPNSLCRPSPFSAAVTHSLLLTTTSSAS